MQNAHPSPAKNWQRTIYILFAAQVFTAIGFSSIFPFLPLYVKQLGSTSNLSLELLAGLVFSAQAFTMMLVSPLWGALADRVGRKIMVERAMFGGAAILLLMAFVRSAEELVLLRTVQGLITGTIAAANALAASIVPRERMGYAMGLLQVGMGSGIALGPLIGGAIADAYSYSAAFYVTAGLLLLAGLLVVFGVEEKFEKPQVDSTKPKGFIREWRAILATTGVPTTYSLRFISQLGRMLIVPMLPLFVQTLIADTSYLNTFTGFVIGAASTTTTLSSVYLGRLGDRIGHRRIVIACALAAALLYFVQTAVNASWQLLILQALVGIAMGGIIPAISALLANLTSSDDAGGVYGLDNSINAAGRAIAPMLGSAVAVWFGIRATFTATALLFLATGLLASLSLPKQEKTEPISSQHFDI